MGVVITLDDIRAYAEVDYIINHMNEKYRDRVPQKMLDFFSEFKEPNYDVKINPYRPLQDQGLQRYALEIIALLHLKYWCDNEERKKELYGLMVKNQEKLDMQMRQKYSVENLFDNASATIVKEESDLEEDYSKPKPVQRYSQYSNQNSDIQDFTDVVHEDKNDTGFNEENLPVNNEENPKGFFSKIKQKLLSIFGKK